MTGAELERRDIRRTIDRIYAARPAGCCLHVVTDDRNFSDSAVDVCLRQAEDAGHPMCRIVARFLSYLTPGQRRNFLRTRRAAA